jgi:hypothetical protein
MAIDDVEARFKVIEGEVRAWNGDNGVVTDTPSDFDPWSWTEPVRCAGSD